MAQNFKHRISLFPDSFTKFQNSLKELNEMDLSKKADIDTFNKSIINKNTPKKEKKMKKSLLDTPSIENKKYRKISVYSPISFGDISTPVSKKTISEFNSQLFSEEEIEVNNNINNNSNLSFFPFAKNKKLSYGNKNRNMVNKNIIISDENSKQYSLPLYCDYDIYGQSDIIKKSNSVMNDNVKNIGDNSDDEEIVKKNNLCMNELGKAINYIKNNPNFFSERINNRIK